MNTQRELGKIRMIGWVAAALSVVGAMISIVAVYQSNPSRSNYQHVVLDNGLREINLYPNSDGTKTVRVRDVRTCHDNPDPEAVCHMTEYNVDANGHFANRNSYDFNHGLNVGLGEFVKVGDKEAHEQKASWGIGNPIPYVFHQYPAKSRTIQLEQRRLEAILAEMQKA